MYSYNVLGHFKLCTVIVGGFLVFHDPLNINQGIGIAVALLGIFVYTHFKLQVGMETRIGVDTLPLTRLILGNEGSTTPDQALISTAATFCACTAGLCLSPRLWLPVWLLLWH
jgi:hypothetical protein